MDENISPDTEVVQPETKAVKLYALVQGTDIIEYPVTDAVITARGHDVRFYHRVLENTVELSHRAGITVDTKLEVVGQAVIVTHTQRDRTLEEAIAFFRMTYQDEAWVPFALADVPQEEFAYFQKKLGEAAEAALETVVKERYSSLDTLLGRYANSTNPIWVKEAAFIQKALDMLWLQLLNYFQELTTGTKPLPTTLYDVDALLQPVSWADMV